MNKIICDICGTTYPDTAEQCPICGYANNPADQAASGRGGGYVPHYTGASGRSKGGHFSAANVRKRNQQSGSHTERRRVYHDEDYDYEQEDNRSESNPFLVALLVTVIAALLVVTGIIFFRYYLPNILPEDPAPATKPTQTEATEESTELSIPCTGLAITDGVISVALNQAGDKHLVNVMALPADTTDELIYSSSNEAVAAVNSEGRVTAVGEGEAVITVTCGEQSISCTVICDFTQDNTEETGEATEESTEETTEPLLDIDLKIGYKDVTLSYRGEKLTFKINEELEPEDIIWTSSKPEVATVENGVVVGVGHGTAVITAQYGDQTVECIIRCAFW